MYHYHQCDRQHSLQPDMGSMMLYNMRHNRHSNRTNHFEILHYPLMVYQLLVVSKLAFSISFLFLEVFKSQKMKNRDPH